MINLRNVKTHKRYHGKFFKMLNDDVNRTHQIHESDIEEKDYFVMHTDRRGNKLKYYYGEKYLFSRIKEGTWIIQ